MTFEWRYRVDWDQDGDFGDANEDITADVIEAEWHLGMQEPFQLTADEATAEITLKNDTGTYNPESAGGTIYRPHRAIEIALISGGTVEMYNGWVEKILPGYAPAGTQTGRQRVTFSCTGLKKIMQDQRVTLTLYTDTTGDAVIDDVMTALGITAYTAETGLTLMPFYGDLSSGRSAWDIIADLTNTERGRFYQDRGGSAIWWNRHHMLFPADAGGTVTGTGAVKPKAVDYGFGRHLFNIVRVEVQQRTIEGSSVTLWSLEEAIYIPAGGTRIIEVTLRKSNGQFAATGTATAGTPTFSTGTATITVATKGGKATITVANGGTADAILTALTLSGTPTITQNLLIAESTDTDSINEFGPRTQRLALTGLAGFDAARDVALYELGRLKQPFGDIRSITFINAPDGVSNQHQYTWQIGTLLNVALSEISHDRDYFIIGEDHKTGAGRHETTFYLEPADLRRYWILQHATYGKLESTTRLGY